MNAKVIKEQCKNFTFIDLFAGIGGFRLALEKYGGKCVFSSEWDNDSQEIYFQNFGDTPFGDITQINEKNIPNHDVLCAGFPCQAFSVSGKQLGLQDTRGTLFFDIARIVKFHKPKVLFLENVKNLAKHDEGKTLRLIIEILKELGYRVYHKILRSSDYCVPQARERIYIVAFRKDLSIQDFYFPEKNKNIITVKNILEKTVSEKYHIKRNDIVMFNKNLLLNDKKKPLQIGRINKGGQGERIYSIEASGITLSAYGGGAASKTGAFLVKGIIRKLTPRECARLQGFPDNFIISDIDSIAYKQLGNSVSVPVLEAIVKQILKSYNFKKDESQNDIVNKKQLFNVNLFGEEINV